MRVFLVVFALVWLVGISGFLWWRDPAAILAMTPGEWGEFLSGLFGPPGFIAVVATLIQQGNDLKDQRKQIDNQLKTQIAATEATKILAQAGLDQALHAAKQADASKEQATLATERMLIERMRNRSNSLAMMAVRYADRLRTGDTADGISLIGSKDELADDLKLGAEAVLETVRIRLRANLHRIRAEAVVLTGDHRNRVGNLLNNLLQRVDAVQSSLASAPIMQEIDQLKGDLLLGLTRERLRDVRDALGLPEAALASGGRRCGTTNRPYCL